MLSREEARAFYDRFGARQDAQAFYEDPATDDLIAHAEFDKASAVYEFGCGTGRFAEKLLGHHLSLSSRYTGTDISSTMVDLSRERLDRFEQRACVSLADGAVYIDASDGSLDRVVSNYVLDLLPDADIVEFMAEASRVLAWDGYLCLVGLTKGRGIFPRLITALWELVHRIRPAIVGGCRPLEVLEYLPPRDWTIVYHKVVTSYGVPSEIVVAQPGPRRIDAESVGTL